ncbi:hypothetical protein BV25DRAFT_1818796 [Artomyces pyxidatus]|uniref:Uncharacterized protein n=1 Tax=Artomyces pyxidatus TaxID=48021 RepID=A0ACB8TJ51_9AGAM|nr:hypothetical protein BV25DRAFT_1818796 [Artomyces pyxidatus]
MLSDFWAAWGLMRMICCLARGWRRRTVSRSQDLTETRSETGRGIGASGKSDASGGVVEGDGGRGRHQGRDGCNFLFDLCGSTERKDTWGTPAGKWL